MGTDSVLACGITDRLAVAHTFLKPPRKNGDQHFPLGFLLWIKRVSSDEAIRGCYRIPSACLRLRSGIGCRIKRPSSERLWPYYTVFSLAPMVLLLFAVFGLIYGNSEVARREILQQLYSFLDRSSAKAVQDIAASVGKPTASVVATVVGIAAALFGASGVFGQLQDALNTIWGVKPKPGKSLVSFLRARFLSFAMVAGVCFLLLVSLTASAVITAVGGYLEHLLPGANVLAWTIHLVLDISIVTLLFAMIFKFLPDARLSWRDVRLGAVLTAALFLVGKYALGLIWAAAQRDPLTEQPGR
jgi:uncharacterized BrkB/YihY/UPF0761 family membrane protein